MKTISPDEIVKVEEVSKPALTPEQADVMRRLEAYPYDTFNLHNGSGRLGCFVCVARSLGSCWLEEAMSLRDMCGRGDARELMENLTSGTYGRAVPGVKDHPEEAVPKSVAIQAVRSIFEMANREKAITLAGNPA